MYLDVIVIGCTFQEHLLLREVFQWFQEAHLKLNMEKCQISEGSMVPKVQCAT